jgi:hypothetical protein
MFVLAPALALACQVGACGGGSPTPAPVAPVTPAALDTTGFLEAVAGTAPLVIVAPHGGSLKPANIPDRTCAGCEFLADANTEELARLVVEAFVRRTAQRPYLALNHLHRVKFDGNRDRAEATGGNAQLDGVWTGWQSSLDSARLRAARLNGRALYVELHGHAHAVPRIEIGYLLSAAQLRTTDATLHASLALRQSSIARLAGDARSGASDVALLRGAPSLGALLVGAGYASVPSPADPAPKAGEDYFNGGYNTVRHGSADGGFTDAVQVECNFAGVRDTAENRALFADALAGVLVEYLKKQYGWPAVP